jgi:hypothetical protein
MRTSRPRIAIVIATAAALLATGSPADVIDGGQVSGTWTTDGSPYLVTGAIEVPEGATLTIEPGVEVRFQDWVPLTVRGCLLAVGAEGDSIRFHAEDPATGWHGLRFLDTGTNDQSTSELAYCIVEDGLATGSCPANTGGGLYLSHARADIRHCRISQNRSVFGFGNWGGGGVAVEHSNEVVIAHCLITDNQTGGDGGGLYLYWSTPSVHDNVIRGNQATRGAGISAVSYAAADIRGNVIAQNQGQGVYLSGSHASLVNNRIEDNQGSGVEGYLSNAHLIGNLIVGNQAVRGGGVLLTGSDFWLTNNTIAGNDAAEGGGIYATYHFMGFPVPSEPVLTNEIVYGNTAGTGPQIVADEYCIATLQYCDVQDLGGEGTVGTVTLITGNIDLDPLWAGSGDHPYALTADSPCRDAGIPDPVGLDLPDEDLMGHDRVCNGCVDMGAYEFDSGVAAPDAVPSAAVELLPAYPNPFNPRVTVAFRLAVAGSARLELFDLAGRQVATLWDGPAPAGITTVTWNGQDRAGRALASGAYVARLDAGATSRAQTLTLVR